MKLFEEKTESRRIYDGKILKLDVDRVRLPDGRLSSREVIRHSGGAAVLLIRDGCVLLVKQFRYAYGEAIYEIPAGKLNEGEDPIVSAARELVEETGYSPKLRHMLDIYPTPGYTDEIIHIYEAVEYEFVGQKLDDGEFLNCEFVPLERVRQMIDGGQICDAKTVAAIFKYLLE